MGLRTALKLNRAAAASTSAVPAGGPLSSWSIASPWQDGQLSAIVWADILDTDLLPLSRAEALTVPAMARARDLVCTTIAGLPLRAYRGDVLVDPQPGWMYRTDGLLGPWHRMLWTLDDLVFYGWSLWAVTRGADRSVLTAERVPVDRWSFDDDGRVLVDDGPADADRYLLIPGPHEGVLARGATTLRAAARLERAASRHADNPVPSVELHQTVDYPMTDGEVDKLLDRWVQARKNPGAGAVAWTSYGVEARMHGAVPEQLLLQGRNAAAVDVARVVGIPAALLDATTTGASLTYETTAGRNAEFVDYGLSAYTGAVESALSQDDVVPRGQRAGFDRADLVSVQVPTTIERED